MACVNALKALNIISTWLTGVGYGRLARDIEITDIGGAAEIGI